MSCKDTYKYLGVNMDAKGNAVSPAIADTEEKLKKTERMPYKNAAKSRSIERNTNPKNDAPPGHVGRQQRKDKRV